MKSKRKHLSAETKLKILQEFLQKRVPVSELSETHDINPQYIYQWQNTLFSEGSVVFERKNGAHSGSQVVERLSGEIEKLKSVVASKNEVISELMSEYVKAKKQSGEI